MEDENLSQNVLQPRWKDLYKGLIYLGVGGLFGLFSITLLMAVDDMGDYYYVPHACAALECTHEIKKHPMDVHTAQLTHPKTSRKARSPRIM